MNLLLGIIVGVVAALAMGFAMKAPAVVAGFEKRKQKYLAGKGKNPELDFIGPHKSFAHNGIIVGVIFALVTIACARMANL